MPRRFRRKSSAAAAGSPDEMLNAVVVTASQSPNSLHSSPENFVTRPPRTNTGGLTGKISTLFRRESSHSIVHGSPHNSSCGAGSPPASPVSSNHRMIRHPWPQRSSAASPSPSRGTSIGEEDDDDDDDDRSAASRRSSKRIFYSSTNDDDSDDSYESRVSRSSRHSQSSRHNRKTNGDASHHYRGTGMDYDPSTTTVIQRYRGFSTSIRSLFLDEPLVCAAMGCFGLILSNRTEYLLQLRNERRGLVSRSSSSHHSKQNHPSRIIAYGLVFTLVAMFATFVIWGFGTGNGVTSDYMSNSNGNNYNNDNGNNNNANDMWDDYLANNDNNRKNYHDDQYYNRNNYNNNNNNQDDQVNNNDDANGNNDDQANNDYYNLRRDLGQGTDDDDFLSVTPNSNRYKEHRIQGIFKMRDSQEGIWDPFFDWLGDMGIAATPQSSLQAETRRQYRRRQDEYSSGSSSSNNNNPAAGGYRNYQKRRDLASDIRIGLLFAFLLFLGILGRRRRMRTRFYIVRARAQEDHLYYASSDREGIARKVAFDDTREDQYEGACSHTLCGCYPVDEHANRSNIPDANDNNSHSSHIVTENVAVTDNGIIFKRKTKPHHEDIVARCFNCCMATCCGVLFKCWFQCLSICALAQEAREMRLLVPPRYQRVDFITHQPFHEYQYAVNDLRRGWLGKARQVSGLLPHYNALSRLSRYILVLSFLSTVIIVATLLFNPRAAFSWQDAVVLVATFVQSFLVLFIVHWIFHKSDLSLDAVIKMFAAGFLIAVPTAFFFEGLLVNLVLLFAWILYDAFAAIIGDGFSNFIIDHWRAIWIVGELFNAYIVAAVVEELCKYYTFRAVEHPDLIFLTGLQRENQEESAVDGGLVKYPFASHQVSELSRKNSFSTQASEHSHRSSGGSKRHHSSSRSKKRKERLLDTTGTDDAEFEEDDLDVRTRRQKAMAITTGMISVAVGLACAENFLYVFVLGGAVGQSDPETAHKSDVMEAWIVLFFRSIFPVHALAAAMQSINMIRKFVENETVNGHRIGVGRIILPAVILHGTFDAVLMGINVFVETSWDQYLEKNGGNVGEEAPYNAILVNAVAWISITAIMLLGMAWYFRENRSQRNRLKLMEEADKSVQVERGLQHSRPSGGSSPSRRSGTGLEII